MSKPNRAPEIAVFAIAMLIVEFIGAVYSIFVLGQTEGAIGNEFDNLKVSALLSIPIVALASAGYWLSGHLSRGVSSRVRIIISGVASGALLFAWSFIVPLIPTALNLVGFVTYCVVLGALSRVVVAWGAPSSGAV